MAICVGLRLIHVGELLGRHFEVVAGFLGPRSTGSDARHRPGMVVCMAASAERSNVNRTGRIRTAARAATGQA